ncbi:transcriptional regulator, AraC family [Dyella jiangningensis]|uniref:helix-turn-helix transcriptional regulator n=1 Tax=Dyella sp. AtDHG13 TaxID=1938897 RepID=UPI000889F765|nr:AraC family transcriptional regulator [Dyella sp. AtDHG13]PXV53162.1 AraC family transcriptional regulator [Dyella sp. AtDHG13]SDL44679.1 transcriptional regulator, AraC family [Dyella jiangningensis]
MYIEPNPSLPPGPRPPLVEPALESLLNRSMLQVQVVAELHRCGTWFADAPRHDCGLFHLVGAGGCSVECDELDEPIALEAGDLVIFPHGTPHRLGDTGTADTPETSLICGEFRFTGASQHPLSLALPSCMVIHASRASTTFRQLATTMADVVHADCAGRHVLLNKLADALFTLAICDYSRHTGERQGLFASLADPRIARVLQAVHDHPGKAWTMQSMAALACMSRSAFAERFTQLMKLPPIQYLTQWRVSMAEQMLRDRQQSVAGIAQQLGYSSEAAFRRLFKRVSGVCPGRVRGEGLRAASIN